MDQKGIDPAELIIDGRGLRAIAGDVIQIQLHVLGPGTPQIGLRIGIIEVKLGRVRQRPKEM